MNGTGWIGPVKWTPEEKEFNENYDKAFAVAEYLDRVTDGKFKFQSNWDRMMSEALQYIYKKEKEFENASSIR